MRSKEQRTYTMLLATRTKCTPLKIISTVTRVANKRDLLVYLIIVWWCGGIRKKDLLSLVKFGKPLLTVRDRCSKGHPQEEENQNGDK